MLESHVGEQLPETIEEIEQIMREGEWDLKETCAELFPPEPGETRRPFLGWTAQLINQHGDQLSTTAFDDWTDLVRGLFALGVTDIEIAPKWLKQLNSGCETCHVRKAFQQCLKGSCDAEQDFKIASRARQNADEKASEPLLRSKRRAVVCGSC